MWVNDVLARLVEMVIALPKACVETLSVGWLALGMVVNTIESLMVCVGIGVKVVVELVLKLALTAIDLVPSAL